MTFIVPRRNGTWEVRESRSTPAGPRSRTLATFRELTDDVVEHARTRASTPLDADTLRRTALRVGAPVAESAADRAARQLLRELNIGRRPRRALRHLLAASLEGEGSKLSDTARAAGAWIAATPEQHGEALRDLLLLADRLPPPRRRDRPRFPRFEPA